MENEKCVLLKKSEYKALLDKIEELSKAQIPNKIIITYDVTQPIRGPWAVRTSGNIDISQQLNAQICRILRNINIKYQEELKKYDAEVLVNYKNTNEKNIQELKHTFAKLPWYKRLFYTDKL